MHLLLQVKLLRVLEERRVRPVGASQSVPIDVRLVSATHRTLEKEIPEGRFREDLYYRLNVVTLTLPALSERRDDIPVLAAHFLGQLSARYGRSLTGFSPDAMELLVGAAWPGNVRQLHNVVEHAVALSTTPLVPTDLIANSLKESQRMESLEEARARFERDYLARALRIAGGNVTHAARLAKRNRTEFYKLLQRHQLDPAQFK
jgi:two-component system response regulator GlrR